MFEFSSIDKFKISGHGIAFVVKSPEDNFCPKSLINEEVIIDNTLYKVKETSRNRVCVAQAPEGFDPDFIAEKVPAYANPKETKNA